MSRIETEQQGDPPYDKDTVVAGLRDLGIDAPPPTGRPKYRWWKILFLVPAIAVAFVLVRPDLDAVTVKVKRVGGSSSPGTTGALEITGNIVAKKIATVSSNVTGLIREIYVDVGSRVEAGQAVAMLDDRRVRIQIDIDRLDLSSAMASHRSALAKLKFARLELGWADELMENQVASPQQRERLRYQLAVAAAEAEMAEAAVGRLRAQIKLREKTLDDLVIRAPFSGVVTNLAANIGEIISPSSAGGSFTRTGICTIVSADDLELAFTVNERQLHRIKVGGTAEIGLAGVPGQKFIGSVARLDPAADPQTGTVKVYVVLDTILSAMKPGLRVSSLFLPPREPGANPGVILPATAIHTENGQYHVFVVRNGLAHKLMVQVERRKANAEVVLADDWTIPQTVIISSEVPLRDQMPVRWQEGGNNVFGS